MTGGSMSQEKTIVANLLFRSSIHHRRQLVREGSYLQSHSVDVIDSQRQQQEHQQHHHQQQQLLAATTTTSTHWHIIEKVCCRFNDHYLFHIMLLLHAYTFLIVHL